MFLIASRHHYQQEFKLTQQKMTPADRQKPGLYGKQESLDLFTLTQEICIVQGLLELCIYKPDEDVGREGTFSFLFCLFSRNFQKKKYLNILSPPWNKQLRWKPSVFLFAGSFITCSSIGRSLRQLYIRSATIPASFR
jgi:hypothetical protein